MEEASKNIKYYKFVELNKPYESGKCFTLNEIIVSDKKINTEATDINEIGGFCISDYDHIFRWLIRGDYLCEVLIPEDTRIYKTESKNGIYVAEKIILTNPIKMDDNQALKLYKNSKLPEVSYFRALAACCIKGYMSTSERILQEKISKSNKDVALQEFEGFCKRREEEYKIDTFNLENVKIIHNKLKKY